MNVLVGCKRAIDYAVKIRVLPGGKGIEKQNVKHSMNPFDEIAVIYLTCSEEAVRLKEAKKVDKVYLCSIGPNKSQEVLRTGLAMGGDEAIHVDCENDSLEPLQVAKVLKTIVDDNNIQLVILGKQSIDDDCAQTAPLLAGLLNWSQATFASKIKVEKDQVEIVREVDGGLETLSAKLPLVISTDLRLNEPRYATLPNIMKAKKKPLKQLKYSDLISDKGKSSDRIQMLKVEEPPKREAGKKVESVSELINELKSHGVI